MHLKEIKIRNISFFQIGIAILGIVTILIILLAYIGLNGFTLIITAVVAILLLLVFFARYIIKTKNDFALIANRHHLFISELGNIPWKLIDSVKAGKRIDDSMYRGDDVKEIQELFILLKSGEKIKININHINVKVEDLAKKLNRFVKHYTEIGNTELG